MTTPWTVSSVCLWAVVATLVGCGGSGQETGGRTGPETSGLEPAVSEHPTAGACAELPRRASATRTVVLNPDTPVPRCLQVRHGQRLRLLNHTNAFGQRGSTVTVGLGSFRATIAPGEEVTFDKPFGSYLAPGDHTVRASYYAGGNGPEVFLREPRGTAPAPKAKGSPGDSFPPSIYPRPAPFPHWGSPNGCASLKNVTSVVPREARHASLRVLSQWGRISETRDLHLSDRAEWPIVRESWRHRSGHRHRMHLRAKDVVQGRGKRSPYAGLVRHNCGARILQRSWWVAVCPGPHSSQTHCTLGTAPALTGHFMLLNRRGHWLVWFTYP